MDNPPATNPSPSSPARFLPWLMVLIVLLFTGYIRVRLLEMPLERDEGEYAYAGQLILQGIPPYELAYNMKLPGTYYAYAAGMAVFGQTIAGIHLTLIAANSLTIIFVFLLGRKLFGVTAGLVACASYAVMSVSPEVAGLAAHANQFVVLFAVPATLLLLKASETNRRSTVFFSGLLYGLAFLMKQQGFCFGLFGLVFLFWQAVQNKSILTRPFAVTALLFTLGIILPFVFLCLTIAIAGDFDRFWLWTFTYAGRYATTLPLPAGIQQLSGHLKWTADVSAGFWILVVAGLPFAWRNKLLQKPTIFTLLFWVCSFAGTATGLYFRNHYFILILPAFAILIGLAVEGMQAALPGKAFKHMPLILFIMISAWTVFHQRRLFFQSSPVQVCQNLYPGNPFVESLEVARYIREHSTKDAQIAVMGSEPQIYFYAQRHSATGYIYTYALMDGRPYALAMQHEMMEEVESNKPEYLVYVTYPVSWLPQSYSDRTIFNQVAQYAARQYEIAGVAGVRPDGKPVSLWDDAAKDYPTDSGHYLVVYHRKADAGTVSPGTNQPVMP